MTWKLTIRQQRELVAMYRDRPDMSTSQIAAMFGVHPAYVSVLAKRRGVPLRNPQRSINMRRNARAGKWKRPVFL